MVDSKKPESMITSRLAELRKELEKREPALVREIEFLENLSRSMGSRPAVSYADITSPRTALMLCLHNVGDFKLTKKEILSDIMEGGYLNSKPKTAANLLNDSFNYHVRKGALVLKGDLVGRNHQN